MFAYVLSGFVGAAIATLAVFLLLPSVCLLADAGMGDLYIAAAVLGCAIAWIGVSAGQSVRPRRRRRRVS